MIVNLISLRIFRSFRIVDSGTGSGTDDLASPFTTPDVREPFGIPADSGSLPIE